MGVSSEFYPGWALALRVHVVRVFADLGSSVSSKPINQYYLDSKGKQEALFLEPLAVREQSNHLHPGAHLAYSWLFKCLRNPQHTQKNQFKALTNSIWNP